MPSYNNAVILGNLGQDPDVKYTAEGKAVATLSVATAERYKDREGAWKEQTEWHRVVVWGDLAERCGKYLAKGEAILCEGRLQTRSYEKDEQTHHVTEVVARSVQFLGRRKSGRGETPGGEPGEQEEPRELPE